MEIYLSQAWTQLFSQSPTRGGGDLESLPDEILTDVLGRLQADQVVKLRSVCKKWSALTTTPYFARLHVEKATSSFIVFQACLWDTSLPNHCVLFYIDRSTVKKLIGEIQSTRRLAMSSTTKRHLLLRGCCNGLLIFRSVNPYDDKYDAAQLTYYIYNPMTQEQITVISGGEIFGFFFKNKYNLLRFNRSADEEDCYRFGVGSLGPMIWREAGRFPYRPRETTTPSVVDGCLHWMSMGKGDERAPCSHSIMVFRVEDGEFRFMPHPGKSNQSCQGHRNMQLLSMKGRLYAYRTYAKVLSIWLLEDSANWRWVKKFKLHLERDLELFSIDHTSLRNYPIKLIEIWEDQLLLMLPQKGIFRYNPQSKKVMEVLFGNMGNGIRDETRKGFEMIIAECTMSFVSLWDY